jgi:ribosomal protein L24E
MTALARDCKWCGASMEGKRSDAIFCSRKCYAVSYRKANPEYHRKYQREYQRKYAQANPDYHSNYRQANRERIAERDRVKRHALKQETDQ